MARTNFNKATAEMKTKCVMLLMENKDLLQNKPWDDIVAFVERHDLAMPKSTLRQQCKTVGILPERCYNKSTLPRGQVQRDIIRKMARIIVAHMSGKAVLPQDVDWLNEVSKGASFNPKDLE